MPVLVASVRCKRPRLLFAMAGFSVQRLVLPLIPTTSPAIAVASAAALARSEAFWRYQPPFMRAGLNSIVSPDAVTTMVRVPSRIGYTG